MTEQAPPPLKPLPENWSKAVAIVAHPDDMEFGAAAAVARWTGQGKNVVYAMVTSGEAGIDGLAPDECRAVREQEEIESARIVGVDSVVSPPAVVPSNERCSICVAPPGAGPAGTSRSMISMPLTSGFSVTWVKSMFTVPSLVIGNCFIVPR